MSSDQRRQICVRLSILMLVVCLPRHAWAYIDVGAGSMLLQGAIAAVLAGGYAIKLRWRSIAARFSSPGQEEADPDPDADATETPDGEFADGESEKP